MHKIGIPKYLSSVCCAVCTIGIATIGAAFSASAQTPVTDPSFEVATVKPVLRDASHPFDGKHYGPHIHPTSASYWSMTPAYLISYAYRVDSFQVAGPDWASHDSFDIEARLPEGADKNDERRMLQTLLKDRFKLSFHIEKREVEGHVLVVGKHGQKLSPSLPDPASPETNPPLEPGDNSAAQGAAPPKITKNPDGSSTADLGKRGTQTVNFDHERGAMHFEVSKMTIEDFAGMLSNCLGTGVHKVVDETGIKGTYQLAWYCPWPSPRAPIGSGAAGALPSDPQDNSSLTQSLDALGLKLEKRKFLLDIYVIDHVERPSEN